MPDILDHGHSEGFDQISTRQVCALHILFAFRRQANDLQILVFTCRQRAFEKLGAGSPDGGLEPEIKSDGCGYGLISWRDLIFDRVEPEA